MCTEHLLEAWEPRFPWTLVGLMLVTWSGSCMHHYGILFTVYTHIYLLYVCVKTCVNNE